MSLRERMGRAAPESGKQVHYKIYGVHENPFPAAGQTSGHPRQEDLIDDQIVQRVQQFESNGRPSQVIIIEGTQGVGKTNFLNYYEQDFRDYYSRDEAFYIIRFYPDPEPSFDSVIRRIFQGLDHDHFKKIGSSLANAESDISNDAKEIARSHDVRIVLNSLEKAGKNSNDDLEECARLALEWFGGLRLLKRHREILGVDYRLDTVESRTQALRDIVYVSEKLNLLKGILLLLDELEKQDYSLSKTPVLRFLSAIRALIDALPRVLFLILAMTPQARLRYFAMLPALDGRLQDILSLHPIKEYSEAIKLYDFYVGHARETARNSKETQDNEQGMQELFNSDELKDIFNNLFTRSSELGREGITQRDFLHHLHGKWEEKVQ